MQIRGSRHSARKGRRRIAVAALGAMVVVLAAEPAWAPPAVPGDGTVTGDAGAIIFDDRPAVWAGYTERPRPATNPGSTGTPAPYWCALWIPPLSTDGSAAGNFDDPETRERVLIPGGLYLLQCFTRAGQRSGEPRLIVFEPRDPTDGTVTTRADVVEYAIELLPLAAPGLVTQPPPLRLVTGFETWITTAAPSQPQVRTAQAGQFWATADARPVRVQIDTGDGTRLECPLPAIIDEAGRPVCARHTYLDRRRAPAADGRFTMTASITYEIWVTTDRGGPLLFDTRQGPTTTLAVQTRDVQAVLN
jgi:hypothetical protein